MKCKISLITFIFVFLFLICTVSAADYENETLTQCIPADTSQDICAVSVESADEVLKLSSEREDELLTASKTTVTKQKVTMKASDVSMYYKGGKKLSVTVKDSKKKAINKLKLKITINDKTYEKTTDSKGTATLELNLKPGTYKVVTSFAGTNVYESASIKNTVTIKSTIKSSDLTKYYKNTACYYSTFYDSKGKLIKNTAMKLTVNGKTYSVKTNSKGTAKLAINLKPGTYSITSKNLKTSESLTKTIKIKSLIETKDLTMTHKDGSKFTVKILNSNGKASPNKKVSLTVNGKTYAKTTDKNGKATLVIGLNPGTYKITTEFGDLKTTNQITVNKLIKHSPFLHSTIIPSYVNVTTPYVFYNSAYALKTGVDGIIQMPKQEIITVQTETKSYTFTTNQIPGISSTIIGHYYHLVPFNGGAIKTDINKDNLKEDGIIISSSIGSLHIDYQSKTETNLDLFGFYAERGAQTTETLTYIQNNKIKAKVNLMTYGFDETGLRYNLAKFFGKSIYDFNYQSYDEITKHTTGDIKFVNTGEPVTFSYFGKTIVGYLSKENITTKFKINGKEELEKTETLSYGLSEKYRTTMGFEVLQSYAVINEKINSKNVDEWLSKNSGYLNKAGIQNVYGMFLTSLETAWRADELANSYAKVFNVNWERDDTATILSGINLDNTYIHILNSDMGMLVTGKNTTNITMFKLINSLSLPEIEETSLSTINETFEYSSENSLSNILTKSKSINLAYNKDLMYLQSDNSSSVIIINTTSGVSNVLMKEGDFFYKGSSIKTTSDCCLCSLLPGKIVSSLQNAVLRSGLINPLVTNYLYPVTKLIYKAFTSSVTYKAVVLAGASALTYQMVGAFMIVQEGGITVRDSLDKKHWHTLMDTVTYSRPGYFQAKKIYNIPTKNGKTDYIEVPVKSDMSLDRENAQYISEGNVKKLTKTETYQYFDDEYWTPVNVPTKYWDESWK